MASKNIIYKVNGKPNVELIEKFDNNRNTFYRWQDPYNKNTSRSCSWGMISKSKREAISDWMSWMGCDRDEAERDAILPGKSCMPTFREIYSFARAFGDDDVLLIFEGSDTRTTGHDGECVATYYNKVAVWSIQDCVKFYKSNYENEME